MTERLVALNHWVNNCLKIKATLLPLCADASFRRYFRLQSSDRSFVVMDCPPDKEGLESFIGIAKTFKKWGVNVPTIHASDSQQGFLLLDDFGDRLYSLELNSSSAAKLYQTAMETLFLLQQGDAKEYSFPLFDAALYRAEMNLFKDWYLEKELGVSLSPTEKDDLEGIFSLLIADALKQPQGCVHRDFHARNLMVLEDNRVGVLDFQDAVWGPVTYDLLSLLRDCYIDWPREQVEGWAKGFFQQARVQGGLKDWSEEEFLRGFDWIGLQRHLKCMGIFARLKHRDGKEGYIQYIPRVLHYTRGVCEKYPEFKALKKILARVSP